MGSASKQASAGDKPVLVTWDGEQLWAVLPNVNGDATVAANGYYTGFVTKWQATSLVSGGSYFNPLTFDANRGRIEVRVTHRLSHVSVSSLPVQPVIATGASTAGARRRR